MQVSRDLDELKDSWTSIATICEGLSRHSSAKDEGFMGSLNSFLSGIESFEKLLAEVYLSIIYIFPSFPEKVESQKNEILEEAKALKGLVKRDQTKIESLGETDEDAIKEKLKILHREHENLERETTERCNKYFERKREHTIALETIDRQVGRKIGAVREMFNEKITGITDGYEISINERIIQIGELFDALILGRVSIEDIQLKPQGAGGGPGIFDTITGKASTHEMAKESVLKYEAQEIVNKAMPFKKKEAELISKLNLVFNDLKGLETDCNGSEKKRKKVESISATLQSELEGIKTPEQLKDIYLTHFNKATPKVDSFISLAKIIGESSADSGEDREKILAKIAAQETEVDKLKTKIIEGMDRASLDELYNFKERAGALNSQVTNLISEIESRIREAKKKSAE